MIIKKGKSLVERAFSDTSPVVKTEDGYYFFTQSGSDKLMFYDTNAEKSVVVCNKMNCTHKDGDASCNAVFLKGIYWHNSLTYYQGNLYVIENKRDEDGISTFYLIKISKDGSQRENVMMLCSSTNETITIDSKIYDDYIYYTIPDMDSIGDTTSVLARRRLKNNAKEEVIFEYKGISSKIHSIKEYENNIYFQAVAFDTEKRDSYHGDLYVYDTKENKTTIFLENVRKSYLFADEWLIYDNFENIERYHLKTKERSIFLHEGMENISYDGEYVYIDNGLQFLDSGDYSGRSVRVFDLKGEQIDEIPFQDNYYAFCYFGDREFLFADISKNTESSDFELIHIFDKSQIGTGKYEWKPLEDIPKW